VVLGTVHVVKRGVGGAPTLVRVDVEKVVKAPAEDPPVADASLTLFVVGERPTTQASAPSLPWFASDAAGRHALFLKRSPAGFGWSLEAVFAAGDALGREKAEVLEREVALTAVKDPVVRRRRAVDHLLGLLEGERIWSRNHAARELLLVATAAPEAFDESSLGRIESVRRGAAESRLRGLLAEAIEKAAPGWTPKPGALARPDAPPPPASPEAEPAFLAEVEALRARWHAAKGDESRVAALSALARAAKAAAEPDLLRAFCDESAAVRERAAVLLGDVRAVGAVAPLLAAFPAETDTGVRVAIVRAIGLTGDDRHVPWLAERFQDAATGDAHLERPALFALARIRTSAALAALGAERERVLGLASPDRGVARLIDYLRSAAFETAERAAGRAIGSESGGPR
jgi:HEAT repeat protein